MAKKIVVINGSLRARGNTDTLVARLLDGIQSTDAMVTHHRLRDEKIAGCRGCYYCYRNSRCAIKDDMQKIHGEIQDADLLVLASPLYWWGVTGLMKTFIDRLYLYYPKANTGMIAGKQAIILTPMHVNAREHGERMFRSEIEPLKMTYEYTLNRLGVGIASMVFYPGLNAKGDAKKAEEYLRSAFETGKALGRQNHASRGGPAKN